jgi:hypothetical protein
MQAVAAVAFMQPEQPVEPAARGVAAKVVQKLAITQLLELQIQAVEVEVPVTQAILHQKQVVQAL